MNPYNNKRNIKDLHDINHKHKAEEIADKRD